MRVTRAQFLKACGMAAAAAPADLEWLPWSSARHTHASSNGLPAASSFTACIDQRFHIASHSISARLIEVAAGPQHDRVEQHSLMFTCDGALTEGIHHFTHDTLGAFDLFISPVGRPVDGARMYQACISRMVTA
jgi:hypothetical protein